MPPVLKKSTEYEFRLQANTVPELEQVTALFKRVWPANRRFNFTFVEWLYARNPNGPAIGYNAFFAGELIAHYVVIPFLVDLHGQRVPSALALNTSVDERHRGQGLFRQLAERAHERAAEIGIDHIVAIANASSTPTFVRHLGFRCVTQLNVEVLLAPIQIRPEIQTQWRRRWQVEDLAWRLSNPGGNYWRASNLSKNCHIVGTTKYPGVHAVLKVEADIELRRQAETQLVRRANWRPLLWFGKSPQFSSAASVSVPLRLRPSPFNFIYRGLKSGSLAPEPEQVHFEAADFDVM